MRVALIALFIFAVLSLVAESAIPRPTNAPTDPEYNETSFPPQIREPTIDELAMITPVRFFQRGVWTQSPGQWRDSIATSEATYGSGHPVTANLRFRLGVRQMELGEYSQGLASLRVALTIQERTLGVYHRRTLWTLGALARQEQPTEAERHWIILLERESARSIAMAEELARLLRTLAVTLRSRDRAVEASEIDKFAETMRREPFHAAKSLRAGFPSPIAYNVDVPLEPLTRQEPELRRPTALESLSHRLFVQAATAAVQTGDARLAERAWSSALQIDLATWGLTHAASGPAYIGLAESLASQGRDDDAERYMRHAVTVMERHLGKGDERVLDAKDRLAGIYLRNGKAAYAEAQLRELVAIQNDVFVSRASDLADAFLEFSSNQRNLSNFEEAESSVRKAIDTFDAIGGDGAFAYRYQSMLANILADSGRYAEAISAFEKAHTLYGEVGVRHPLVFSPSRKAQLASDHALARLVVDQHADVRPVLEEALRIYGREHGADSSAAAMGHWALARFFMRNKEPREALPHLSRAFDIMKTRGGPDGVAPADAAHDLSIIELALGRVDSALSYARDAFKGRLSHANSLSFSTPERRRREASEHYSRSAFALARANWSVAVLKPEESAARRAEAFAAIQFVARSTAADAMSRNAAQRLAADEGLGALVESWQSAVLDAQQINQRIIGGFEMNPVSGSGLSEEMGRQKRALDARQSNERALSRALPAYFEILRSPALTPLELQSNRGKSASLLRDDEALIVLNPGDATLPSGHRNGLVFAVTKHHLAWAEIKMDPETLARETATLHKQLALGGRTMAPGSGAVIGYERVRAHRLFNVLFGDPEIAAIIGTKQRWLLAPQGALVGLPFAALVAAEPSGGEEVDADPEALRRTRWLGLERTLVLTPSVPMLRTQRLREQRPIAAQSSFFGLGDPAFRGVGDEPAVPSPVVQPLAWPRASRIDSGWYMRGMVGDSSKIALLPRLPATNWEVRTIASYLGATPGDFLLQTDATEAELRRRDGDGSLAKADVIVFATHGLLAGSLEGTLAEPALVLTPPASVEAEKVFATNDGLLTASEAATLTLNARLVILSACDTAAGDASDSESLTGLAKAFLFAGAESLLVSHYRVQDESAQRLTTTAIAEARRGVDHAEALRIAMRKVFDDRSRDAIGFAYSHPSAWGAFTVIDAGWSTGVPYRHSGKASYLGVQ